MIHSPLISQRVSIECNKRFYVTPYVQYIPNTLKTTSADNSYVIFHPTHARHSSSLCWLILRQVHPEETHTGPENI